MMDEKDRDEAIATATSAWRPVGVHTMPVHPAWYDLDPDGRREVHDITRSLRTLEAAIDDQGWSSTVHSVLRRLGDREPYE